MNIKDFLDADNEIIIIPFANDREGTESAICKRCQQLLNNLAISTFIIKGL